MSGARRRVLWIMVSATLMLAVGAFAVGWAPARRETARPVLLLLTSLPIVFGEELSLQSSGSPTLAKLDEKFRVIPIATASERELQQGKLLLMAQPLAQPAEDLVALDDWVRRGGRLVLLADPLLERPDSRDLSDSTRPPPMFMDTGLLAHWGLRLDAPDQRGPGEAIIGERTVSTLSSGRLHGSCAISSDKVVARCTIGSGVAVVIADADFIDQDEAGKDALVAELESLEQ
jgi:hypothetical protein